MDEAVIFAQLTAAGVVAVLVHTCAAPYAHLGLRSMPLGGVGQGNMGACLADPHVPATL